jgi:hypothetical protein
MIFEVRIRNTNSNDGSVRQAAPAGPVDTSTSKYGGAQEVQTLKQYLCQSKQKSEETLRLLLQLLDQCQDSPHYFKSNVSVEAQQGLDKVAFMQSDNVEAWDPVEDIAEDQKFTLALTLFTSLMIKNEQILESFQEMGGFA